MRFILLTAFSLVVTVCQAQETKTKFGLKSGFNVAVFSASINSESSSRIGFHLGAYARVPISEKFFFRPEMYYSGQGQKDDYQTPPNGPSVGSTTTRVNYLNVPLLFEAGRKVNFQFGPQVGFLLSAREEGTIDGESIDDDLKSIMKSVDFSFALGLGLNAGEHTNFGIRYNAGLTTIFDKPSSDFPDVKNQVFHFFVGYSF